MAQRRTLDPRWLAPAIAALIGCTATPPKDPSYVLVELRAAPSAPAAARVEVLSGDTSVTTLCVRIAAPSTDIPASFVLRRDAVQDPSKRITIKISAFALLSGAEGVDVGKEFVCPTTLPASMVGEAQVLTIDFCESHAQRLVVNVGAICGCGAPDGRTDGGMDGGMNQADGGDAGPEDADASAADAGPDDAGACGCLTGEVCGAGLSSAGRACLPDECCGSNVSSACALDPVR